jgi:RHS repeat-associated protein
MKFTGQELDEETGLYYFASRYYDPAIGRFISADSEIPSVTDGQAFNRYSYVRNNPILYTDPTGHSWKVFRIVATAVLFAAAIVLTVIAPPIGAPILIGMTAASLAGAYSAYQAAGGWDWDVISKGMLVGAVAGGLAGLASGPLGIGSLGLSGFWGSVATGAMAGAVNGFATGIATGYQGGVEGWEKTFWQTVAIGTLAGAATGALFGGLKFSMGKETMEWPSTKDVFKIKLTGDPGMQSGRFSISGLVKGVFVGLSAYAQNLGQNVGCYLLYQPVTGLIASSLASGAAANYSLDPFPIPDFKVTKTFKFDPMDWYAEWFGSN